MFSAQVRDRGALYFRTEEVALTLLEENPLTHLQTLRVWTHPNNVLAISGAIYSINSWICQDGYGITVLWSSV